MGRPDWSPRTRRRGSDPEADRTLSGSGAVATPGRSSTARSTSRSAAAVGGGILLSRITGFGRDLAIAFFFGTGLAVDAYTAALRIPNILRNLLGEGTLSAAFVPVYSAFLAADDERRRSAGRLARGVLGLTAVLAAGLAALGVLLAPILTRAVAPGFDPEGTALTTSLVRILFPMAGIMMLAAWCLGVLNSHRRFFLPFGAPALWNLAQIGGLLLGARMGWEPLVFVLAWSTLAGSVLQLGVQLPACRRLVGRLRPALEWQWEPVRRVARNMAPVAGSQGIFQFSSYVDVVLASTLPTGAISGLYYAQRLAYLPLSLFGASVATAALPEMSRDTAPETMRRHLVQGFFRILYFVLPSAAVFLLFGDLIVALLFQRGAFGPESSLLVSWILGAYALGLVPSSSIKLFAGGFHALQDTATPMRLAAVSVGVGVATGAGAMLGLASVGFGPAAAAGLAAGGALGAWLNLGLLWHRLGARIGVLFGPAALRATLRLAGATAAAAAAAWLVRTALEDRVGEGFLGLVLLLLGTLAAGGVAYLAVARRPPDVPSPHAEPT